MPMTRKMDNILYQYFQKTNLEEVELQKLKQFVNDFPFCATGQFLLAKKYHLSDDPSFLNQASKTAIYFTNPHWFKGLLLEEEIKKSNEYNDEKITIAGNSSTVTDDTGKETENSAEEITAFKQSIDVNEISSAEDIIVPHFENQQLPDIPDETLVPEAEITAAIQAETEDIITSEDQKLSVEDLSVNNEKAPGDEIIKSDVIISPESAEDATKPLISSVKLKSILDNPVQPDQNGESLIPIEPLHTVDYFASQGIKISANIEGQDRLSIKLRSFTDWLKTMKKIHPEKLESELDQGAQTAIQHIAEHSNEAKEVVTEAMAEVFAKQGLNHKALEVYRKLSLLNPDKRVYFAAKISKLNDL